MFLLSYYQEHAEQARQHENQRERMSVIVLSIASILIGLITYSNLAAWSVMASCTIIALGAYGLIFSIKHYERNKLHTTIMKHVRKEIERKESKEGQEIPKQTSKIREEAEVEHYRDFTWWGSQNELQATARSWIARQRLHIFWEIVHVIVIVVGIILTVGIVYVASNPVPKPPIDVRIVPVD